MAQTYTRIIFSFDWITIRIMLQDKSSKRVIFIYDFFFLILLPVAWCKTNATIDFQ